MNTYLITYDLKSENKDYSNFYACIKGLGDWQHPLDSVWLVKTSVNANNIFDILRNEKDEKDLILVIKVDLLDTQGWLSKTFWDWVNASNGKNVL